MRVIIAKTHENLFDGEAASVTAPTTEGELTILPHHEPLVSALKSGTVTVRTGEKNAVFEISSGVLEVSDNRVTVLL